MKYQKNITKKINKGEERMRLFKVFSVQIAMQLCELGYKVVLIQPNRKYRKYVYCYEETEELKRDFEIIQKNNNHTDFCNKI